MTIDASTITGLNQTNVVTLVQGSASKAEQQQVTINAIGGHFKLTYGATTPPAAYNASALQVQEALEALPVAGVTITVSKNSNQYVVTSTTRARYTSSARSATPKPLPRIGPRSTSRSRSPPARRRTRSGSSRRRRQPRRHVDARR